MANTLVTLVDAEQYQEEFPPSNLLDFQAWLDIRIGQIPEEYLPGATIDINSIGGYEDSHYAQVVITYLRPETDGERAVREQAAAEREAVRTARELAEYERLKAKFNTTGA